MKAKKILLMDRHEICNPKIVTTEMFNEAIAELEALIKLEEDYQQALDKLKDGHVTRLGVGEYNIHMINNGGKIDS